MTEKIIEFIKWTPYRLWKLTRLGGPPPDWDWKAEREKIRKERARKRLKLIKKD